MNNTNQNRIEMKHNKETKKGENGKRKREAEGKKKVDEDEKRNKESEEREWKRNVFYDSEEEGDDDGKNDGVDGDEGDDGDDDDGDDDGEDSDDDGDNEGDNGGNMDVDGDGEYVECDGDGGDDGDDDDDDDDEDDSDYDPSDPEDDISLPDDDNLSLFDWTGKCIGWETEVIPVEDILFFPDGIEGINEEQDGEEEVHPTWRQFRGDLYFWEPDGRPYIDADGVEKTGTPDNLNRKWVEESADCNAPIKADKLISRGAGIPEAIATCTLTKEDGTRVSKMHYAFHPTLATLVKIRNTPFLGPIREATEADLTGGSYDQGFLDETKNFLDCFEVVGDDHPKMIFYNESEANFLGPRNDGLANATGGSDAYATIVKCGTCNAQCPLVTACQNCHPFFDYKKRLPHVNNELRRKLSHFVGPIQWAHMMNTRTYFESHIFFDGDSNVAVRDDASNSSATIDSGVMHKYIFVRGFSANNPGMKEGMSRGYGMCKYCGRLGRYYEECDGCVTIERPYNGHWYGRSGYWPYTLERTFRPFVRVEEKVDRPYLQNELPDDY